MPTNRIRTGIRMPSHVLNSAGVWVANKFAGMRLKKNTRVSDIHKMSLGRKKSTHTSPVVRTMLNDGHDSPPRMHHAETKRRHALKALAV